MQCIAADAALIEGLRTGIAAVERRGQPSSGTTALPFGLAAIDGRLPWGGLPLGAVHELHASGPDVEFGAAPALFAAGLLARRPGPVVWIGHRRGVFVHGLLQAGLEHGRIVFVDAGKAVLLAMEEALRHPDVAGVVCELEGRLGLVASRRLQLAAEGSDVLGLLIRRSRRFDDPSLRQPPAAVTRWRIGTLSSPPPLAHAPELSGMHRPVWRLDLSRCRGGEPASWTVESCDAQGRLAMAAVLADGQAASARPRAVAG